MLYNCDFVTVVDCASANSMLIPLMVTLPWKNVMEVWVTNIGLPEGFSLMVSVLGYSNKDL